MTETEQETERNLAETPADGQTIESAAPSYSDLIKAEGALPMAYEKWRCVVHE